MHATPGPLEGYTGQRAKSALLWAGEAARRGTLGTSPDPKIGQRFGESAEGVLAVAACAECALARLTTRASRTTHASISSISAVFVAASFTSAALALATAAFATGGARVAARGKTRRRAATRCRGRAALIQGAGTGLARPVACAGSSARRQIRLRIQLARHGQAGQADPTCAAEGSGHDVQASNISASAHQRLAGGGSALLATAACAGQ
jgi:hypothetical protein